MFLKNEHCHQAEQISKESRHVKHDQAPPVSLVQKGNDHFIGFKFKQIQVFIFQKGCKVFISYLITFIIIDQPINAQRLYFYWKTFVYRKFVEINVFSQFLSLIDISCITLLNLLFDSLCNFFIHFIFVKDVINIPCIMTVNLQDILSVWSKVIRYPQHLFLHH